MRDPFFRPFGSSPRDSWIQRIRENFRQAFAPVRIFPSPANGAPLHALRWERSARSNRAHGASLLTHAAVITVLLLAVTHPPGRNPQPPFRNAGGVVPVPPDLLNALRGLKPNDGRGSGGGNKPIPATNGNFVPVSSIQIVRPSLPLKRESIAPVPPTILDPSAPSVLISVNKIGLPWMHDDTNSPGPGDSNTIGNSNGRTMGDGTKDGPGGRGDSSFLAYAPGVTLPTCVYCPDPQYPDEAREAKMQGRVTLRVLVGADGRASQIQIVQGIGMGLDERAVQSVRSWKFTPGRDGARRAVSAWITIEIIYRLI